MTVFKSYGNKLQKCNIAFFCCHISTFNSLANMQKMCQNVCKYLAKLLTTHSVNLPIFLFLRFYVKSVLQQQNCLKWRQNCTVLWKSITIKRDHAQKFPSNHLFCNFFSENVDLTEKMLIFRKNLDRVLNYFSTLWCMRENFRSNPRFLSFIC